MAGWNRVGKAVHQQRINWLLERVSFGYNLDQLYPDIVEEWAITERQYREYKRRVAEILAAVGQETATQVHPRLVSHARHVQQKGHETKDYRLSLMAAKEEADLYGLHQRKEALETNEALSVEKMFLTEGTDGGETE